MRKQLFNHIEKTLSPLVATVDIWNDQLLYIEQGIPFATPAVLVEFFPITWNSLSNGVKEAEITFSLHIVTDSAVGYAKEALKSFELIDDITAALFHSSNPDINTITNISSETDHNFDELQNNIETYKVYVTDYSSHVDYAKIKAKDVEISIKTEG